MRLSEKKIEIDSVGRLRALRLHVWRFVAPIVIKSYGQLVGLARKPPDFGPSSRGRVAICLDEAKASTG